MNLSQPVAVGIWVVIGLGLLALVIWGFTRLKHRGADAIGDLPEVPSDLGALTTEAFDATYVSSTLGGQWLERIGVHHLGDRARATVGVFESGVLVERAGSEPLFIARSALNDAHMTSGMAGKHTGSDMIVVISWDTPAYEPSETIALDTGLHVRRTSDRERLLAAVNAIVPSAIDGEETS